MNKLTVFVGLMLLGLLVLVIGAAQGCMNPPDETIEVDINGPLEPGGEGLAYDKNRDGKPDRDPNGVILLVPGSKGYATAARVDLIAPEVLALAGSTFGVGIVGAVGLLWKRLRFGRAVMNGVMAWQEVRQYLAKEYDPEVLAEVDGILKEKQTPTTIAVVKEVKDKIGLASATS